MDLNEEKLSEESANINSKVTGTVKWFNVKNGFGFITRNDTKEDVFVHLKSIEKFDEKKAMASLGDGETVIFNIKYVANRAEAINVTGPDDKPVKGSPFIADKRPSLRPYHGHRARREVFEPKSTDAASFGDSNDPPPSNLDVRSFYRRTQRNKVEEFKNVPRPITGKNSGEPSGICDMRGAAGTSQGTVRLNENKKKQEDVFPRTPVVRQQPPQALAGPSWNLSGEDDAKNEASYYYNLIRDQLYKK